MVESDNWLNITMHQGCVPPNVVRVCSPGIMEVLGPLKVGIVGVKNARYCVYIHVHVRV